jgi:hypothetical protein
MAYPTYRHQQLRLKPITRLKPIHADVAPNEQATDQAVASEKLTTVEISFYDREIYCGSELIATIAYDHADFVTQPWVVMTGGAEKFRANTSAKCHRYIQWHHHNETLNEPIVLNQVETLSPSTTDREIMAQIFSECKKFGFVLLDSGIYNNVHLGEVDCTLVRWWVVRANNHPRQKTLCDSVSDAVQISSMDEVLHVSCEELLDRPFDQLTADEWRRLGEYEPVAA